MNQPQNEPIKRGANIASARYEAFIAEPRWPLGPLTDNECQAVINALNEILAQEEELSKLRKIRREKDPKAPLSDAWAAEVNESTDRVLGAIRLIRFLDENDINELHTYSRSN